MNKSATKSATKSKAKALSDIYRDTEKGPVKIRTRARANGNLVVYLDIYDKGERRNVVLTDDEGHPLYLWPEKGAREREKNRATWEMARYCKSEYILTGMTAKREKAKNLRTDFFAFLEEEIEHTRERESAIDTMSRTMQETTLLNRLKDFTGAKKLNFSAIDVTMIRRFIRYLSQLPGRQAGGHISPNSVRLYLSILSGLLQKAVRKGYMGQNPFDLLEKNEKPKEVPSTICYLTPAELGKLKRTPCRSQVLRDAFFFACLTGLRYSDIIRLRWNDINRQERKLSITVKKTHRPLTIPLAGAAFDILDGLDRGAGVDGLVFPELAHMNRHTVGRILGKWAEDAGVRKKVRFHVSRHTCATMQLSLGVGLMTIRDQLGHKTTAMTQVYAEVMDEDRRKAADVQGDAWSKL